MNKVLYLSVGDNKVNMEVPAEIVEGLFSAIMLVTVDRMSKHARGQMPTASAEEINTNMSLSEFEKMASELNASLHNSVKAMLDEATMLHTKRMEELNKLNSNPSITKEDVTLAVKEAIFNMGIEDTTPKSCTEIVDRTPVKSQDSAVPKEELKGSTDTHSRGNVVDSTEKKILILAKCDKCLSSMFLFQTEGSDFKCNCGHHTKLENLIDAEYTCKVCYNYARFSTNKTRLERIRCKSCKSDIAMEFDAMRYKYMSKK